MFSGSIVAIATPFKNGKVDDAKLKELVGWQIEMGTSAIVPCGTTGESPTLSYEEHHHVIEVTVKAAAGQVPVIAGAGSNSTEETLALTRHAKKVGADAVLLVNPYYNRPTQRGLVEHFRTVTRQVPIPVVLYNIPGRTGVNMLPETVAELAREKNIVAIKEAAGSVEQVSAILSLSKITVLSGDDGLTLPMMSVGAKGVISVAANIVPADTAAMVKAALAGKYEEARKWHYKMHGLFKNLFLETNPVPVKAAMRMMGLIDDAQVRLPLCPMSPENEEKLKKTLVAYGINLKERAVKK